MPLPPSDSARLERHLVAVAHCFKLISFQHSPAE